MPIADADTSTSLRAAALAERHRRTAELVHPSCTGRDRKRVILIALQASATPAQGRALAFLRP